MDNPSDPGGATYRGLTLDTFRAWNKDQRLTAKDLRSITNLDLQAIYKDRYWSPAFCDQLPSGIDLMQFDMAVNAGSHTANELLQRSLGFEGDEVDGDIGPATLAAVKKAVVKNLLNYLAEEQRRYYTDIVAEKPELQCFLNGWLDRVGRRIVAAKALIAAVQ